MRNMFWLELLHAFVKNLEQIQLNTSQDSVCTEQVFKALDHLQRGLVVNVADFNKNSDNRVTPPSFEGNLLKDVTLWLLRNTGSASPSCREKCMSMFLKLAPLVKGCKGDTRTFIDIHVGRDPEWICDLYERELIKNPTLDRGDSSCSSEFLFKYLSNLLCALEGYIFVIGHKLTSVHYTSRKSKFVESFVYFLDHVQAKELNEALHLLGAREEILFKVTDRQKFNLLKSCIAVSSLKLLSAICDNYPALSYLTGSQTLLESESLQKLICNCIFNTSILGFYTINDHKIKEICVDLLNQISDGPNEVLKARLSCYFNNYIAANFPRGTTRGMDTNTQNTYLDGLLVLQKSKFSDRLDLMKMTACGVVGGVYDSLTEELKGVRITIDLDSSVRRVLELKLQFCLHYETEFRFLIEKLFSTGVAKDKNNADREVRSYLFETFKKTILTRVIDNFETFIQLACRSTSQSNLISYVFEVIQHLQEDRKKGNRAIKRVAEVCLDQWNEFQACFEVQRQIGVDFFRKLSDLYVPYDLIKSRESVGRWIISLLMYRDPEWSPDVAINFCLDVVNLLPCVCGPDEQFESELK